MGAKNRFGGRTKKNHEKRMKILILFKKWPGGVGSVVKEISDELEKRGHKVKVISREDDLKIYSLLKSVFLIRKKIKNIMKKENYDIIYTQDWSMAFPLLFPKRLFFEKLFCVFNGENPKKQIGGYYLQKIIGKIMGKKLIVCNDILKKNFPESNLIYNRVNSNIFKPNPRIKKIKDSVGFANWKTNIYNYEKIKKSVAKTGKKLITTGDILKEKMPDFYRQLEVFISLQPSYAGFGLVYLEAMASGVPKIIGNKFGGGKVLPITKIEDYDGNIEKAILNAKKRNYRKWIIENNFTWEDAVEKLIKIFEKNAK